MNPHGVVFMTALLPTLGHEFLLNFAANYLGPKGKLSVILSIAPGEPTTFLDRVHCFYSSVAVQFYKHNDPAAPQNPTTEEERTYWVQVAQNIVGSVTHVFASELYGAWLAEGLGADFVPVDVGREYLNTKGSTVRKELFNQCEQLTDLSVFEHKTHYVLFGAESVGKTTMTKALAHYFSQDRYYPEWARGYLETVGPELNEKKLLTIARGQLTLEECNYHHTLVHLYDTDYLSTVGYFRLYGLEPPDFLLEDPPTGRHYLVLHHEGVTFEPDPLRYGGDRRESDTDYWVALLEEFKQPYTVLKGSFFERQEQARDLILDKKLPGKTYSYRDLINYRRE